MAGDELHVVFGASGGVGNALIRELAAQGKRVRGVNRSGEADVPDGVEMVAGNAADPPGVRGICKGATAVYNCVFPPTIDALIEGAADTDARLVYTDGLSVYGPVSGPITEDLPYQPRGKHGIIRAQMATTLMDAHRTGKVRAAIGRASDVFGPGVVYSIAGAGVFQSALAGKAASSLGDLDTPHTYTFNRDYAKALGTLGTREEAMGQIWHVPNAETLTTRQFVELVFEEVGTAPRFHVPRGLTLNLLALISPAMRQLKTEKIFQFEAPFIVDHGKYERTFGAETTPLREAIRQTLDWFRLR